MSIVELLAGLALFAFGWLRDALAHQPLSVGLKQFLLIVAGAVMAIDALTRMRSRRRAGLLAHLDDPDRPGVYATAVLGAALLAVTLFSFQRYVVDDAFITFRFARNALATGHPVWNLGERPVEGYSNFLWMLIAMGALRAGIAPLVVARLVATVSLVISSVLVHRLARRAGGGVLAARLALLAFLATPAFTFWTVSGLETISIVALTLATLVGLDLDLDEDRFPWRGIVPAALLVLSRPEAPLTIGLVVLPVLIWPRGRDRGRVLQMLGIVALATLPYAGWKLHEFGTVVANTVSAKARPLSGLKLALEAYRFAFPFLLLSAAGFARGASRLERQVWVLFAGVSLAAMNVAPQVAHYLRFFLPSLAGVLAIGAVRAEALLASVPDARKGFANTVVALTLGFYLFGPIFEMRTYAENEATGYEHAHTPVGRLLARAYGPGDVLAASDCGIVPYLSRMRTIDIWGLTDRRIATRGFDRGYVMAQRPQVVVIHSLWPGEFRGREPYDEAMYEAVQADPSLKLRGRWGFFGYWMWVYSQRPLATGVPDTVAAPVFN